MITKEENILFHAEKLFAEKGFEGTSTREISKAANVNISMISYYFGSKEKLFEKLFELRINEGKNYAIEILEKNNINEWEKMNLILDRYIERVRKMSNFFCIMQTEQLTNKNPQIVDFLKNSKLNYLKVYERLIKEGCEKKIFSKRPHIPFLHATITGTIFQALNGIQLYKEHLGISNDDENFNEDYFEKLNQHIKQVLKDLLGYEK